MVDDELLLLLLDRLLLMVIVATKIGTRAVSWPWPRLTVYCTETGHCDAAPPAAEEDAGEGEGLKAVAVAGATGGAAI